jgi:LacI family transcriptional regulator
VDGLVIVPAGTDHRFLRPELAMGTVAVFLDRPPGAGIKADAVLFDNAGGAAQAVDDLVGRGHRRVAVLGDRPDIYTMVARVEGFRAAMESAGVPVDERLVVMNLHSPDDAAAATGELLDLDDPPTAFFPLNNRMTVGAVRAAFQRGSDAAIIGFDDFELADLVPMPFKVVAASPGEMGRLGAELLFERLTGMAPKRARQLVVGTEVLERGLPDGEVSRAKAARGATPRRLLSKASRRIANPVEVRR